MKVYITDTNSNDFKKNYPEFYSNSYVIDVNEIIEKKNYYQSKYNILNSMLLFLEIKKKFNFVFDFDIENNIQSNILYIVENINPQILKELKEFLKEYFFVYDEDVILLSENLIIQFLENKQLIDDTEEF